MKTASKIICRVPFRGIFSLENIVPFRGLARVATCPLKQIVGQKDFMGKVIQGSYEKKLLDLKRRVGQ